MTYRERFTLCRRTLFECWSVDLTASERIDVQAGAVLLTLLAAALAILWR